MQWSVEWDYTGKDRLVVKNVAVRPEVVTTVQYRDIEGG